jgi:hypothetical protein
MGGAVRKPLSRKRRETGPEDYYEILRVHPSADASLIHAAYWHLARECQARIGAEPNAIRRLDELNEAYRVLSTPALRQAYDRSGRRRPPAQSVEGVSRLGRPRSERTAEMAREDRDQQSLALIRWEMPALQAAVVACGLLVLAGMALWYGAPVLLTLILAGVALFFALFPWRFGRVVSLPWPRLEGRHEEPSADASALRESTAAMVARWREEANLAAGPSAGARPAQNSESAEDGGSTAGTE